MGLKVKRVNLNIEFDLRLTSTLESVLTSPSIEMELNNQADGIFGHFTVECDLIEKRILLKPIEQLSVAKCLPEWLCVKLNATEVIQLEVEMRRKQEN